MTKLSVEIRQKLIEDLKKLSEEQLEKGAIDTAQLEKFLELRNLGLTDFQIGKCWEKLILFLILLTQKNEGAFYVDEKLFDLEDQKTAAKLQQIYLKFDVDTVALITLEQYRDFVALGGEI